MIICFCNNVSQSDIIEELKKNKSILEALGDLYVGTGCGICLCEVNKLFDIDRSKLLEYYKNKTD